MTNDTRRALEDAIISYGVAKALHATSEPEMRPVAENALSQAWDRVQDAIDEVEKGNPTRCDNCEGTGIVMRMGSDNMDMMEWDCPDCRGTGKLWDLGD